MKHRNAISDTQFQCFKHNSHTAIVQSASKEPAADRVRGSR